MLPDLVFLEKVMTRLMESPHRYDGLWSRWTLEHEMNEADDQIHPRGCVGYHHRTICEK
jgi:hypothetical protein